MVIAKLGSAGDIVLTITMYGGGGRGHPNRGTAKGGQMLGGWGEKERKGKGKRENLETRNPKLQQGFLETREVVVKE
jgi:hypothetical protein